MVEQVVEDGIVMQGVAVAVEAGVAVTPPPVARR